MTNKAWSGRFAKSTDKLVEMFTESISFDVRLIEHDNEGSVAHARMLGTCGIIPEADAKKIVGGLEKILDEYAAGKVELDFSAEDVHMNVEKLLFEKIGDVAGKLHTARSRNDQIATDIRLFLKAEIARTCGLIELLQDAIVDQADANIEVIMPGFTHLQHAQPILLAHHLMAYFWMLDRDRGRLEAAREAGFACADGRPVTPYGLPCSWQRVQVPGYWDAEVKTVECSLTPEKLVKFLWQASQEDQDAVIAVVGIWLLVIKVIDV